MCSIIKLRPQYYVHILDRNTNVTSLVVGPQTYTCYDHQRVVLGPEPMIVIPPLCYVIIQNPVKRDNDGKIITDQYGQVQLHFSEKEIRMASETSKPFPLYPGETFDGKMHPLKVVEVGEALRIRALVDFEQKKKQDNEEIKEFRNAGDMWLFEGPGLYIPTIKEEIVEVVKEFVIQKGQALKIKAIRDCIDKKYNKQRKTGDHWLMTEPGAYLPGPYEKVIVLQDALILTEKKAYHLKSVRDHTDIFGNERPQGKEWLVTFDDCSTYQLDVYEEIVKHEEIIVLSSREYMVMENPTLDNGRADIGKKLIIHGPKKLFLSPPFERNLEIGNVIVLDSTQAVELQATESFYDEALKKKRKPGEKWLHKGPGEYWPVLEAKIIAKKRVLFSIEGLNIYIFDSSQIIKYLALFCIIAAIFFKYIY